MTNLSFTEKELVRFWTEFIDWKKREKGENGFFGKLLREHGCQRVFDSALGDGYDSISLLKKGFSVVSNEVDPNYWKEAKRNAKRQGVELDLTPGYDWRDMPKELDGKFDAVVCLGNSLTYLHEKDDQLKSVIKFRNLVRKGGIVVIDSRNYD